LRVKVAGLGLLCLVASCSAASASVRPGYGPRQRQTFSIQIERKENHQLLLEKRTSEPVAIPAGNYRLLISESEVKPEYAIEFEAKSGHHYVVYVCRSTIVWWHEDDQGHVLTDLRVGDETTRQVVGRGGPIPGSQVWRAVGGQRGLSAALDDAPPMDPNGDLPELLELGKVEAALAEQETPWPCRVRLPKPAPSASRVGAERGR
jgi:hypothetical protein